MRKFITSIAVIAMAAAMMTGCGSSSKKAENGEISTKALDLRGILASLRAIRQGLIPSLAVRMGVINKCFDGFEKEIVEDVVMTRIPEEWTAAQVI